MGIEYWEIGNENFGTGYYGGGNGYAENYAVPYDGTNRDDHPALSPAAYGQEALQFIDAMKAVDPTIKAGVVLATPPGDYSWSYADLNDNGVKNANEPYWNDEVLSQTGATGKVADKADFVIVHWYPWFAEGNDAGILNAPRTTIPLMIHGTTAGIDTGSNAGLRDSIATWRSDGNANALEIFVTETDGAGHVEAVDGLFAAEEYITFFENGVSNVDWLELHSGSFLSDANTPNFAYFGIQSVHLLAEAGDELISTTTTESDVRIHASKRADDSVAVMVLNLNTSGTRTVNVSINGSVLSEDGIMYQTDGDSPLWPVDVSNLGNSFSTSIAARTLQLFVIPAVATLDGDFNGDGVVDARDYTVWRDGLGLTYTLNDFEVWKANFGNTSTASASTAGVPEPTTLLLGCAGLLAGAGLVRRNGEITRTFGSTATRVVMRHRSPNLMSLLLSPRVPSL